MVEFETSKAYGQLGNVHSVCAFTDVEALTPHHLRYSMAIYIGHSTGVTTYGKDRGRTFISPSACSRVTAVTTMYSPWGTWPWWERQRATISNETDTLSNFITANSPFINFSG